MNRTILNGESVLQGVVTYIFNPLYQVVAALAVVYFMYGVARFLYDLNSPEKKTDGKNHLLWGLVGLFIIFSVGGILPIFDELLNGMFSY